ncbi:hypothetical protein [Campylobacter corcagiensis]|uniref:Uncharacterized protein n=1 Tax=Campylobacter corcagiensis TaxID=1448857 RepID=A0A7M1LGL1_9BACT|nr:hypothetical protein [Campylobacter corcagiensis]QKF64227.1 putative membrane protein [Campylobacter corcagiensis]QOQ87580.1 hypothetical protein IMC76_01860 [Campylobacter corcagiensis]
MKKLTDFFKSGKAKVGLIATAGLVGATSALADITVDPSTGVMTGKIDIAPYMAAVGIILTALGAFWAVKRVIFLFSR